MPARPRKDPQDLDALPDWRQDPQVIALTNQRTALQAQERAFAGAIADAEHHAAAAVEVYNQTEALHLAGASSAAEVEAARTAEEDIRQHLQRLRGERLICARSLDTVIRALPIAEASAKEACGEALRILYIEAAVEFAALLPQVVAVQVRLAALFSQARRCFPPRFYAPDPEDLPDPVPPNAGLPFLLLPDWIPDRAPCHISPRPPGHHGGKVGKLRKALEAFLQGEGVATDA